MRVLLVCEQSLPSDTRAGRPNYTLTNLLRTDNEVTVICPRPRNIESSGLLHGAAFKYTGTGFEQYSIRARLNIMRQMTKLVSQELNRSRFDLIRTIGTLPTYSTLSSAKGRTPIYGDLSDDIEDLYRTSGLPAPRLASILLRRVQAEVAKGVDYASVETSAARSEWAKRELAPARVVINPNGVDMAHFRPSKQRRAEMRRRFGVENSKVLTWHGDIMQGEGLEFLIDIVRLLDDRFKLMIIGAGKKGYTNELVSLVRRHGIADRVLFMGWVAYSDLPAHIDMTDIGIVLFDPRVRQNRLVVHSKVKELLAMRKRLFVTRTGALEEMVDSLPTYVDFPPDRAKVARQVAEVSSQPARANQSEDEVVRRIDWGYTIGIDIKIMESIARGNPASLQRFDWGPGSPVGGEDTHGWINRQEPVTRE